MSSLLHQIIVELQKNRQEERAVVMKRFFKTGKGEYGEGDIFLGLSVPNQRKIAKKYSTLSLKEIETLLNSPIHEYRLTAILILVLQFQKGGAKLRSKIVNFYLDHTRQVNNWDLVDSSADKILGNFLLLHPRGVDSKILYKLALSKNVWERRISIIATFVFIKSGRYDLTFDIATRLMTDDHDLIHKAVGWMLREIGKRDEKVLTDFLDKHYSHMPRTALRYAIEKLPENKRLIYLAK